MAGQQAAQNLLPSEPEISDLMLYWAKKIGLDFQCHHLGTIQAFDPLTQTADVTINYRKTFLKFSGTAEYSYTTDDYPQLVGIPIVILGGGGGCLTFPIEQGNECLVLFNDRDIDNWYAGGAGSPNATPRTHSFPDAIALVGVNSMSNVVTLWDDDAVALRYGQNYVKIYEDKIVCEATSGMVLEIDATGKLKITNAIGEFVDLLNTLLTDIQNATTQTMLGPQPLVMPTFAADLVKFQSFKG